MNENYIQDPILRYEDKIAKRREKVLEGFDLDASLIEYIERYLPDFEDFRERFIEVVKSKKDKETLNLLVNELEVKINYLGPKSHDTEEDEEYLLKLKIMLERLKELLKE